MVHHCGTYFTDAKDTSEGFVQNKLWLLIGAEHFVIAAKLALAALIPDEPAWVSERVAKEEYREMLRAKHVVMLQRKAREAKSEANSEADSEADSEANSKGPSKTGGLKLLLHPGRRSKHPPACDDAHRGRALQAPRRPDTHAEHLTIPFQVFSSGS